MVYRVRTVSEERGGCWLEAVGAYFELTKPMITAFVAFTAAVGFLVADTAHVDLPGTLHVLLGVALCSAGALALNQYLEREADALMLRTCGRPLPSRRIPPSRARLFACVLLVASVGHLIHWVGWLPALLAGTSAILYNLAYTPLKRLSLLATPVGAIPGALPVLIGWAARTGALDTEGTALFAIHFLWQLVHVLALGWNLRHDYERAGFRLIPSGSDRLIAWLMVGHAALLFPLALAPWMLGLADDLYAVAALVLGGGMVAVTLAFLLGRTARRGRRVFVASLLYHPLLLAALVAGAF
ncbi:MAG: heme o synthase [Gemmatimonadetes bacterium]|nr:heme o synthase [Gemmatimonadota bacterium]